MNDLSIKDVKLQKSPFERILIFLKRTAGFMEVLLIIAVWTFVFFVVKEVGGASRNDIISYLIVGNIIGLLASYMISYIIRNDVLSKDSELLISSPITYLVNLIRNQVGRIIMPFMFSILMNLVAIKLFTGHVPVNVEFDHLLIIFILVFLSFVLELLIALLLNMFVFWTFEFGEFYSIIIRIKKVLSGAFFPLSMLPALGLKISLLLPFAYSFYIPTSLYMKKIDLETAERGVLIVSVWIVVLYFIVRFVAKRKKAVN